jgi:hypothetical protein
MKVIKFNEFRIEDFKSFIKEVFLLNKIEHHYEITPEFVMNSLNLGFVKEMNSCVLEEIQFSSTGIYKLGLVGIFLFFFINRNFEENILFLSEFEQPFLINNRPVVATIIKFKDGSIQISYTYVDQISDRNPIFIYFL